MIKKYNIRGLDPTMNIRQLLNVLRTQLVDIQPVNVPYITEEEYNAFMKENWEDETLTSGQVITFRDYALPASSNLNSIYADAIQRMGGLYRVPVYDDDGNIIGFNGNENGLSVINDNYITKIKRAIMWMVRGQRIGERPDFERLSTASINNGPMSSSLGAFQYADDYSQLPKQSRLLLRNVDLRNLVKDEAYNLAVAPNEYVRFDQADTDIIFNKSDIRKPDGDQIIYLTEALNTFYSDFQDATIGLNSAVQTTYDNTLSGVPLYELQSTTDNLFSRVKVLEESTSATANQFFADLTNDQTILDSDLQVPINFDDEIIDVQGSYDPLTFRYTIKDGLDTSQGTYGAEIEFFTNNTNVSGTLTIDLYDDLGVYVKTLGSKPFNESANTYAAIRVETAILEFISNDSAFETIPLNYQFGVNIIVEDNLPQLEQITILAEESVGVFLILTKAPFRAVIDSSVEITDQALINKGLTNQAYVNDYMETWKEMLNQTKTLNDGFNGIQKGNGGGLGEYRFNADGHPQIIKQDGTTAITFGGEVDISGDRIINMQDPINPQDAATKNYVDNLINNISISRTFTKFIYNQTQTIIKTWNDLGINDYTGLSSLTGKLVDTGDIFYTDTPAPQSGVWANKGLTFGTINILPTGIELAGNGGDFDSDITIIGERLLGQTTLIKKGVKENE